MRSELMRKLSITARAVMSSGVVVGAAFIGAHPSSAQNAPASGQGYWLAGSDGGVFSFGDAAFYGSLPGDHIHPAAPIVGMAATPDGGGYWLVGADGGVFAFGDAGFYGSMGGTRLNALMVGMAATPDGKGYWLLGADGGVFAFGDAPFYGSGGGAMKRVSVVVSIADIGGGAGYTQTVAAGYFAQWGSQPYYGDLTQSGTSARLAKPIVDTIVTPDGKGYWMIGGDGGVFAFGDASYDGSLPGSGIVPAGSVVGGATS